MNDTTAVIDRAPQAGSPEAQIQYGAPPAWVRHDPLPTVPSDGWDSFTDQGVLRFLQDTQISLKEPGVAVHSRVLQRILTRAGAERAANIAIEFDPSQDRLHIHCIRVRRGDQYTDHACSGAMQLLRRESQLERLILNGRLTASIVIPDLREGDQLEVCFTLNYPLAAVKGRYSSWLLSNAFAPWVETRLRLVFPPTRPVSVKSFNSAAPAEVRKEGDGEEYRWAFIGQSRIAIEDLTPTWTVRTPSYLVSEFRSWREVAQLFASHYQDTALPTEIRATCERLASAFPDPKRLVIEWLRFVQSALRYFATVFGDGGLLPRDLETIWQRRFGDCKDAARLFAAGARQLGLDASAALVSTTHGLSLRDFPPSTHVFNHLIVRVRIDGKTYWLDPTLHTQAGSLEELGTSHAGWALPLTDDSDELEALPDAVPRQVVHCEDAITLGKKIDSSARLERRIDFSYWVADGVRHRIANDGASKIAKQLLQELQGVWPRAVEVSQAVFEESANANQISMHCSYDIPDAWQAGEKRQTRNFPLVDTVTNKELAKLQVVRRQSGILLGRPRGVSWRATVTMPRSWKGKGWNQVIEEPGLRFVSTLKVARDQIVAERVLTIGVWSLPAGQADGYAKVVAKTNLNIVKLLAREQFGRVAPPAKLWHLFLTNRWLRALLIAAIYLLYLFLFGKLDTP